MSESKQIFVVGMNGSGTTLVADCLGQGQGVFAFVHETRLLPSLMEEFPASDEPMSPERAHLLWKKLCAVPVIKDQLGSAGNVLPAWPGTREFSTTVDALFDTLARASGQRTDVAWIEKTPMHALKIDALGQRFPNSVFIHVIRDGRDCAASFHRRWRRTPMLTISRWTQLIQRARRQGQALGPSRYVEVRFEAFTADAEDSLRHVCEAIRIEFDPAMTTARIRKKTNQFGAQIVARDAVWKSYFDKTTLAKLEDIAGQTLFDEGYPVEVRGKSTPPSYRMKYWFVIDYARQGVHELLEDVRSEGLLRGTTRFFEKVRAALIQLRQIAR